MRNEVRSSILKAFNETCFLFSYIYIHAYVSEYKEVSEHKGEKWEGKAVQSEEQTTWVWSLDFQLTVMLEKYLTYMSQFPLGSETILLLCSLGINLTRRRPSG